jgi:uncharacterized protein YjiS (DUF1127 family)
MSTIFGDSDLRQPGRSSPATDGHQSNSWLRLLDKWLDCSERARQRADLGAIANDPHLLADLGLTRDDAMEQANTPFWR